MPTERTERTGDVAERILEAATRLFAERGFNGTSVQDIADAVGVRKSSLLYHYASKEELRLAVLRKMVEHWNQSLPGLLAAATSGEGQFDALVDALVAFFTSDPFRARLLVREVLDRPEPMRAMMKDHVGPWVRIVADYIRRGRESGRLQADVDPEAYVIEMIVLMVTTVAAQDCVGMAARADGLSAAERKTWLLDEAKRVARASLFAPEKKSTKSKPKRKPGKRYTRDSYRRAVQRACDKAGVERWSPNQLRHSAATEIRSRYGLEAAQVVLGHAKADVTQVYAERDLQLARNVVREVG